MALQDTLARLPEEQRNKIVEALLAQMAGAAPGGFLAGDTSAAGAAGPQAGDIGINSGVGMAGPVGVPGYDQGAPGPGMGIGRDSASPGEQGPTGPLGGALVSSNVSMDTSQGNPAAALANGPMTGYSMGTLASHGTLADQSAINDPSAMSPTPGEFGAMPGGYFGYSPGFFSPGYTGRESEVGPKGDSLNTQTLSPTEVATVPVTQPDQPQAQPEVTQAPQQAQQQSQPDVTQAPSVNDAFGGYTTGPGFGGFSSTDATAGPVGLGDPGGFAGTFGGDIAGGQGLGFSSGYDAGVAAGLSAAGIGISNDAGITGGESSTSTGIDSGPGASGEGGAGGGGGGAGK